MHSGDAWPGWMPRPPPRWLGTATAFRYDAHSVGLRMDTAKVIPSPAGGYLAVYHDHEVCHLATSTDLMTRT